MEQGSDSDIILPASPRKLYDQISDFDNALNMIFSDIDMQLICLTKDEEDGSIDYTGGNKNVDIEKFLNITLELSTITVTYPLDFNNKLPEVTVTYNQEEVKDVRGLLGVIGEFYERPLTPEQLTLLRNEDPRNEANCMDDGDNHIYNALIHSRGMRTTLSYIDGYEGTYTVMLEY